VILRRSIVRLSRSRTHLGFLMIAFRFFRFGRGAALLVLAAAAGLRAPAATPTFTNVSVHDPSVVRDGSKYYVFGSHLASASSPDLMHWTQLSTSAAAGNPLVPKPAVEFKEALAWAGTTTFWAPDVVKLADGRYSFYYCACKGDSPRSALGIAVAGSITGPYVNQQIILKSGMWNQVSPDGTIYDATKHPNVVDPAVFFDATGRLWMVYGSYSGGIFILQLDPKTGVPKAGQGYGRKLIGGNHARIEGAYVLYSPESKYYYLFLSFGGLAADGGYNIRLGRSRQPDGPFLDSAGKDLSTVAGRAGTLFDDASIAPHGVKLMGSYRFLHVAGDAGTTSRGYVSPGHCSAYYNAATKEYFLVFHTRFVGRGEQHEVRVHPMFLNEAGWLVVAPHRYAGERLETASASLIPGDYKLINHGKAISAAVNTSVAIKLKSDQTVTGAVTGTWAMSGDHYATLTLGGTKYRGVFVRQWDDDNQRYVQAFSALSDNGVAVWGSKVAAAVANTAPTIAKLSSRTIAKGGGTGALAVAIGDAQTVASALTLTAASSNAALVPASGLALGGAGQARTLKVTPAAGKTGTATITLTVSDGALKASASFTLTVANPPTITAIAGQTIDEDTATKALAFRIGDADTAVAKLKVTAASSATTLLPASGLVLAGSGANRTIMLKPAKNQTGTATVTLTVSDGALTASTAFKLTVRAVNDAPAISKIAAQNLKLNTASAALAFTIADAETAAAKLALTKASSNPKLVPLANIVLGGGGANRTVKVTPAKDQSGTATITLGVSDGTVTTKTAFAVTVAGASASAASISTASRVDRAPVLARDLSDRAVTAGAAVTLAVEASGSALQYRWFKDDVALASPETTRLAFAAVRLADAGRYRVVVSNAAGSRASREAELVVVAPPAGAVAVASGGRMSIDQRFTVAGPAAEQTLSLLLPAGWTYVSGCAPGAAVRPLAGETGLLEWRWTQPSDRPRSFRYTLVQTSAALPPAGVQGVISIPQASGPAVIPFEAPLDFEATEGTGPR